VTGVKAFRSELVVEALELARWIEPTDQVVARGALRQHWLELGRRRLRQGLDARPEGLDFAGRRHRG
jgi:hypothetical protein